LNANFALVKEAVLWGGQVLIKQGNKKNFGGIFVLPPPPPPAEFDYVPGAEQTRGGGGRKPYYMLDRQIESLAL
jgi:hypothetical protein